MKLGKKISSFKSCLKRFYDDESGATAIEYGLLAALIAVAMIVGLQSLATGTEGSWMGISAKVTSAMSN